uniref:Uncharacterized protein n=1 Tax=Rhizophora mucronata TaxID=61149 RepID=A0A2P2Q907_RHIMU
MRMLCIVMSGLKPFLITWTHKLSAMSIFMT